MGEFSIIRSKRELKNKTRKHSFLGPDGSQWQANFFLQNKTTSFFGCVFQRRLIVQCSTFAASTTKTLHDILSRVHKFCLCNSKCATPFARNCLGLQHLNDCIIGSQHTPSAQQQQRKRRSDPGSWTLGRVIFLPTLFFF